MSRKRIVLSDEDEEDEAENDNVVDLGNTASAQKLTESICQLKVTDSATKAPKYNSVRRKLFEDEDMGNKQQMSSRSKTLSSKKESVRAQAFAEIRQFRAKGLDAINFDESEEEYYEEHDEDSDIEQFIVEDSGDEAEDENTRDATKKCRLKPLDVSTAPKKAPRRSSTNNEHSSRPSAALTRRLGPSASAMKAFSEYRGNQERDDEQYSSDLDDFIVADDEGDVDEEENSETSDDVDMELDADVRPTAAEISSSEENTDEAAVRLVPTSSGRLSAPPPSKPSKSNSKSGRKLIDLSDNEDSDVDQNENLPHISKTTQKRRVRRTLFAESDDDSNENDDSNAEEEDDEEVDDGPLLYWKLNAQMDEAADDADDNDDAALAGQLFSMNQKFSLEQAFALYLQLLGKALISPRFRKQLEDRSLPRHKMSMYDKASRQIENLICTHRESLLGSSAWQGDFLHELQNRPMYMCPLSSGNRHGYCGDGENRCAACGRAAKEASFSVYLYGPRYEGMTIWSQNKWIQSVPNCLFLHPADDSIDEANDDDEATTSGTKGRRGVVSSKKRSRSSRYVSYEDAAEAAERGIMEHDDSQESYNDKTLNESERHQHKRNKQYSAFQQSHNPLQLNSVLKTPASVASTTDSGNTHRKRSRADSELYNSLQEDNDGEGAEQDLSMRESSTKKRRVVILSDSEPDDNDDAVGSSSSRREYRKTPAKSTNSVVSSPNKWWNKTLPRALNQETESKWELSL